MTERTNANTNTFGKTKVGTRAHARLRVAAPCDSGKRLRESRAWPPVQTFGRKNGAALIDISYFLCIVFRISCAIRSLPDARARRLNFEPK